MLPTRHTVSVLPFAGDAATGSHGNRDDSYGPGVTRAVYGWAPAGSAEPYESGRNAVTNDLDLFVPPDFVCGPHDQVLVNGRLYNVKGEQQDFTTGPFGYEPGAVIGLELVVTG